MDGVLPRIGRQGNPLTEEELSKEFEKPVQAPALVRITNALRTFEIVFAPELETMNTYVVSKKGIYSTSELIERAEEAFSESIRSHLGATTSAGLGSQAEP